MSESDLRRRSAMKRESQTLVTRRFDAAEDGPDGRVHVAPLETMDAAPRFPATLAGRYVPVRLIGRGGMGLVYEVEHVHTGEHLALKALPSGAGVSGEVLERFKREARASVRIKSEHVVRVIDADVAPELDGAPFIVMELLEGTDLEHETSGSRTAPALVVDWLRQVALAIDKAHGLGIIHRDLKPENLFLTKREDGCPIIKILDFGIVKMIEEENWVTASDEILGTPTYMSPEQATAGAPVTPATDRYALGLVAFRLLTGEAYYRGDVVAIVGQLLHEVPRLPSQRHPDLGKTFDVWFARACHRAPTERFASAAEQIEALAAALGVPVAPVAMAPEPSAAIATAPPRSRVGLALLVGAALLAAAILGALAYRHASPDGAPKASTTSS
jgi:serine/threonine protein kinase